MGIIGIPKNVRNQYFIYEIETPPNSVVPTAPEQPKGEMENQLKSPTAVPDAPPDYSSHFVPGKLEVQCPPGVTIGFVAEHWNLCRATYSIQNPKKENMMRVRGPCATYGCGSDSVFEVHSLDGASHIGSIIRKWNGFLSTMANADHFEIHFPLDLDVKMKAMIFGACFLIDFMYFESTPPRRSTR
ncbi:hypothetical protein STEG23_020489 [Scotinomys teguina]